MNQDDVLTFFNVGTLSSAAKEVATILIKDEISLQGNVEYYTIPEQIVSTIKLLDPSWSAPSDTDFLAFQVRQKRNKLLLETDWWAVSDRDTSQPEKDYRQALRDVTAQAGFPNNITWPIKPE